MAIKPIPRTKVLVVDDDVILRDVLSIVLGSKGYDVLVAETGAEALQLLEEQRDSIAIVLTDMHMPGLSGAALADQLLQAASPGTLLIGMSGSKPQAAERAAFQAFLEKPFSHQDFADAVEQVRAKQHPTTTPAASKPATVVLDQDIYTRMKSLMPTPQLRELYRMTLEDVRRRLTLMQAAVASGDYAAFRAEAHAIKGGCGMVGAVQIGKMAAAVEHSEEIQLTQLTDFHDACMRLEDMLDERDGKKHPIPEGEL